MHLETADRQILGMPPVITMNVACFLTTGRADPRFRECASGNCQYGLDFGNVLDLKTSKRKLKHLLEEAPCGYCLGE